MDAVVEPGQALSVVDTLRPAALTYCENPFILDKSPRSLALTAGQSLVEALSRESMDIAEVEVVLNGEILPPERSLCYVPQSGDDIHIVDRLENATWRTIADIGVTLAAAYFTAGAGSLLAQGLGKIGMKIGTKLAESLAFSLMSIGGTMAVNAVASLFQKTPGGSNYSPLGPQTTAKSGIPIPKGYGTIRAGGNIVESWPDIMGNNLDQHDTDDGADTIGRQYLNVRIDFGYGPARSISQLRINDKDIADYSDVAYCLLYGTNDQAPVTADDPRWVTLNLTTTGTTTNTASTTAFDTINNNYPIAQRVRAAGPGVVVQGQRNDTQKLTVFVNFPQGVWRLDDEEMQKRAAIDYDVFYRVAGSGDAGWIHVPPTAGNDYTSSTHYYYNIRQTMLRQATIIDGLAPGTYDVKVVKNGAGAVHNPLDYYEHESNKWGDELWIESVTETSYTTLSYPESIQVCLRYMASDQLAGADFTLSALIEYGLRSTLPVELTGLPEDTPAAVAYDILSDDVIGANLPDSRIDLDFLADWSDLTQTMVNDGDGGTQKMAVFNGIFDQDGVTVWDALQSVGVMSHANFQRLGVVVTGWLDKADQPAQLFHVGNILLDSYSKAYLGLEDRAQEVEVTYADASDDYKTRNPIRVIADSNETSEESLKKTRVNLLGCTDKVQAYYWAAQKLKTSETLLRTHTWKSNVQAIRCRVGNLVWLQHDVPEYGFGGLLQPGSTTSTLLLDRGDIPYDTAGVYSVIVTHPSLLKTTATVQGVSGNIVTVVGYDGVTPVRRLRIGNIDVAIKKGGPPSGGIVALTLDSGVGITAGSVVELWDIDVMETRTVTGCEPTEYGVQVTLAAPLSAVPADHAGYVYQSASRKAIPVRIKAVKREVGDLRYTLVGVDYSGSTYLIPPPTSGASYFPPPS